MSAGRTIARFELQRFARFVITEHPRVDVRALCAAAKEHDLLARDGESRTSIQRTWDLWAAATELSGDRTLALRFGLETRLEDLGLYGFAVLTAATAREATARAARFLGLVSDSGRLDLVERASLALLRSLTSLLPALGLPLAATSASAAEDATAPLHVAPVVRFWPNVWDSAPDGGVAPRIRDGSISRHEPMKQGASGVFANLLVGCAFDL